MSLEPATPWSRVKHSTTEPPYSLGFHKWFFEKVKIWTVRNNKNMQNYPTYKEFGLKCGKLIILINVRRLHKKFFLHFLWNISVLENRWHLHAAVYIWGIIIAVFCSTNTMGPRKTHFFIWKTDPLEMENHQNLNGKINIPAIRWPQWVHGCKWLNGT